MQIKNKKVLMQSNLNTQIIADYYKNKTNTHFAYSVHSTLIAHKSDGII